MILVTGGTGFLGSHLIYHLLQKVDRIRAIKRPDSGFSVISKVFSFYQADLSILKDRIDWFEADIKDIHSLDSCFDGVTEVYHVAGKVSFLASDREELMRINADGTANIIHMSLEKNVRKLLYVSSIAAIGRGNNEQVISEDVAWKSSDKNSQYAISKYAGEREVWRGMAEGLDAVIINPSVILGAGEFESGSARLIKTVENGLKFYTKGVNGFVDVQDVVQIMIRLMESGITGERFIVSSENLTYKTLFEYIAEGLNRQAPKYPAGRLLSGLAWRGALLKSWMTGKKPFISKEIALTASNCYMYTSEKVAKALDYKFKPMRDSIHDICRFHLENIKG